MIGVIPNIRHFFAYSSAKKQDGGTRCVKLATSQGLSDCPMLLIRLRDVVCYLQFAPEEPMVLPRARAFSSHGTRTSNDFVDKATPRINVVFALFLLFFSCLAAGQETTKGNRARPATLADVKAKYLNQKVYAIGTPTSGLRKNEVLIDWSLAKQSGAKYEKDYSNFLDAKYRGQAASVIAIDLQKSFLRERTAEHSVNALGEEINDDATVNPYFLLVVRFEDGTTASTTGYPNTIDGSVQLASIRNALVQEMAGLPGVLGKSLYAVGYSELYPVDTTLDEMQGGKGILRRLSRSEMPLLEPLEITAAKYLPEFNSVVLKLKMPNGTDVLSITTSDHITGRGEATALLQKISGFLKIEIPKDLSPKEIEAIKKHTIFRGMTKDALYYSFGFPEKENDWGRGGTQLVYSTHLIVYVDSQDKIQDWQSFD